jgi:hypothetical protein
VCSADWDSDQAAVSLPRTPPTVTLPITLVEADAPGVLLLSTPGADGSLSLVLIEGSLEGAKLVVTASPGIVSAVVVLVRVSDDTVAIKGASGSLAQLTPGNPSATFFLFATEDSFALGNRSVSVSVTSLPSTSDRDSAFRPPVATLAVAIVDNDVAGVSLSPLSSAGGGVDGVIVEEGTPLRFLVSCMSSLPLGATVQVALAASVPAELSPSQVTCEGDQTSFTVTLVVASDHTVV